ncbi:MAG: hypothetical protein H0T45_06285 [Pyrinomonadaceae bacterium]|nr:hypothetical protein [Pyrinomonadaceae bacterium]MDQ3133777.1 hypothetical protein [Acidobacteriota bacterium]
MTDEEINRKFDVVADLMASLAVKIDGLSERTSELAERTGELAEAQQRAEQRWERTEQRWERTEEGIRALLAIAEIHEREITSTDERLSALINTVERIISERRDKP